MFNIDWIKNKIRNGEEYFSRHGEQERQKDNLTISEVRESLLTEGFWNNILTQEEVKVVW